LIGSLGLMGFGSGFGGLGLLLFDILYSHLVFVILEYNKKVHSSDKSNKLNIYIHGINSRNNR
jgi:hypothetical protein